MPQLQFIGLTIELSGAGCVASTLRNKTKQQAFAGAHISVTSTFNHKSNTAESFVKGAISAFAGDIMEGIIKETWPRRREVCKGNRDIREI